MLKETNLLSQAGPLLIAGLMIFDILCEILRVSGPVDSADGQMNYIYAHKFAHEMAMQYIFVSCFKADMQYPKIHLPLVGRHA